MSRALVTGSAGLIGSETCKRFASEGLDIVGIDNDMRSYFFGSEASTAPTRDRLEASIPGDRHGSADIRDPSAIDAIFSRYGKRIFPLFLARASG